MKKIYLVSAFALMFNGVMAQSEHERESIVKYYNEEVQRVEGVDKEKYSVEALLRDRQKAVERGIPLQKTLKTGEVAELVRFDNDIPIYYRTYNQGSAITSRVNLVQPGGSMGLNLAGQGMIVGVWDQNHPRMTHSDYSTRIMVTDGSAVAASPHSSHVTGTILSSGANNASGRGMAYQANGWVNDWSNDINEMSMLAGAGLLLSNHSYGIMAETLPTWYFGAYVSDANALDNVCFNNPKYQPVFAAGNDRGSFTTLNPTKNGGDLLTGDKVSKNALVVGAVNEVPNYTGSSSVVMSSFSNYGPTDDFRIKPDVVAKGVGVLSTTSSSNTSYGVMDGTSMAAPGVTGGLTLIQQYYGDPYMLSSTLRGLVAHTSDEAGPSAGPDHMFGWGLLNVAKAVGVLRDRTVSSIVDERVLNTSSTYTFNVLANELEKLKVSISWTDRPGSIVANGTLDSSVPRLVNDLDLRVTKAGDTFFPWKLNNDFNNLYALKADNTVDNIEVVEVDNPTGIYQITVSHKGALVGGNQTYSLIVTGIDADADLSINSPLGNEDALLIWASNDPVKSVQYDFSRVSFKSADVFLYDLSGREVISFRGIQSSADSLNVSNLTTGVYLVNVVIDGNKVVKKKIAIK